MEYLTFRPLLFHIHYLQTLEKVIPAIKIIMKRTDKQTFTKTARTAEKIIFLSVRNFPHHIGLVNINISAMTQFLKVLYGLGHQPYIIVIAHIILALIRGYPITR